ncbi:MAG: phosphonopyruvate decarboxylase [Alphaproteobacteria bacterium]|nr:phosphonopyruvate decarboxylase [Alphaproteobacteria bacterium]
MPTDTDEHWSAAAHRHLKTAGVRQVGYVPDAGLSQLIERCREDNAIEAVMCATEEEAVGLAAGAWLGGQKAAVLMQSSGVGNTINAIASLTSSAKFPLFVIVTMRGQWGEGNPWQVPMGQAVAPTLQAVGVKTYAAETAEDVGAKIEAGLRMAFSSEQAIAVLVGQRVIGSKVWVVDAAAAEETGQ